MVNGAGRVANVDGLDIAAGKVQSERRRIALDACLRSTSNPAVYVCGDAVAKTRNFPRSRSMKVGSSAGTSSTAQSIRRITRASRHAYLRCRYWRASA